MKKENKKTLLSFISGAIIFGSIGVGAATYFGADQIKFTPTNESWEVDNAQDAMNDLYNDQKNTIADLNSKLDGAAKVYNLGESKSIDVKTALPDVDYTKLTADNFIVTPTSTPGISVTSSTYSGQARGDSANYFSKSYSASTGVLTITAYTYGYSANLINGTWQGTREATSQWSVQTYLIINN